MGLLSHRVEKSEIEAGDHIYTWRTVFAYSHHGIYVGGNKVIHFTSSLNMSASSSSLTASSTIVSICTTNTPYCGCQQSNSGVVFSCLDCFLGGGKLYRFNYGVTKAIFFSRIRGGTCTTAKSDPPEEVIHRALYLLIIGFGKYNVIVNNCEDFALYCKTGLVHKEIGSSGQAFSIIDAPVAATLSLPLKFFVTSNLAGAAFGVGLYWYTRYLTDLGVTEDVTKVKVEDLASFRKVPGQ